MTYKNRVKLEALRTLAFGGIAATYNAVGAAIQSPARLITLKNFTDVNIIFSIDGVTDHIILPDDGFQIIDITANKVRDDGFFLSEGTVFYARHVVAAAPSSGAVYIEITHA